MSVNKIGVFDTVRPLNQYSLGNVFLYINFITENL